MSEITEASVIVSEKVEQRQGWRTRLNPIREPLLLWAVWRLALLVLPIFAGVLIPPANAPQALPAHLSEVWGNRLIWNWTDWDGAWYVQIAQQGYLREGSTAFFPLYPMLVRWLGFVLGLGQPFKEVYQIAGLLISSLASLVACVALYKLVEREYDRRAAGLSVAMLLAFPTAYYMLAVYTEAIFIALAVGAFYLARTGRWFWALVLAALCVLTKNQGLFVAPALLLEYGQQIGWNYRKLDRKLAYFTLPAAALGGWMAWNWAKFGNPLAFLSESQKFWQREFSWPWQTLWDAAERLLKRAGDKSIWYPPAQLQSDMTFLNVPITFAFIALAVIGAWGVWKGWLRASYWLYFLLCLVQPLFAPSTTVGLYSMSRFMLIIFPAFMLLGLAGRRWPVFSQGYFVLCLPLLGLLVARFTLGYWVA